MAAPSRFKCHITKTLHLFSYVSHCALVLLVELDARVAESIHVLLQVVDETSPLAVRSIVHFLEALGDLSTLFEFFVCFFVHFLPFFNFSVGLCLQVRD